MIICPHCHCRAGRDHRCLRISRRYFFMAAAGIIGAATTKLEIPIIVANQDAFLQSLREPMLGGLIGVAASNYALRRKPYVGPAPAEMFLVKQ